MGGLIMREKNTYLMMRLDSLKSKVYTIFTLWTHVLDLLLIRQHASIPKEGKIRHCAL